ncbi:MAG: hypothetical protein ACYDGR_12415 [Candidatus Dormibacteria bacterium]
MRPQVVRPLPGLTVHVGDARIARLGRAAICVELNAQYVNLVVERVLRGQGREAA